MSQTPRHPREPDDAMLNELDRYLDGQMPKPEAQVFAKRLASDTTLQTQVQSQAQIDSALQRAAAPPGDCAANAQSLIDALHENEKTSITTAPGTAPLAPPATARPMWLKVAAVVTLLVLGGIAAYTFTRPNPGTQTATRDPIRVDVVAMYRAQQGYGFKPDWVCDAQRFTQTCQTRLGSALSLAPLPEDRAMLGMTSISRGDGRSLMMLGQAQGEDVIVYIDHDRQFEHYDLNASDGLHIHQTTLHEIRLIEVSPLEEPVFLSYLDLPAVQRQD